MAADVPALAVAGLAAAAAVIAAPPLAAQPTALAPRVGAACCDPAPLEGGRGLVLVVDTLPGLLRDGGNPAGLAAAFAVGRVADGRAAELRAAEARPRDGLGRVRVGGVGGAGAFRRPQQPARTRTGLAAAEGVRALGGARGAPDAPDAGTADEARRPHGIAGGRIAYERRADRAVAWANVADPLGRTPYVWADSVGGDWSRDVVALGAALATDGGLARGRLDVGLAVDYAVGQGARGNDPRPLWRRRWLAVTPGLAWRLAPGLRLGVTGTAGWEREDQEIGGGLSADFPVLFRLRGPATFDRTQLISAERAVLGRALGGGVQLAREAAAGAAPADARWQWVLALDARRQRDSVRDGIATPVSGGTSVRQTAGAGATARRTTARGGLELGVRGAHETLRGTDPVFVAVNAVDEGWQSSAEALWWRGPSRPLAAVSVGASVAVRRLQRRDVVAEVDWTATTPEATLGLALRRPLGPALTLLGALEGRAARAVAPRWASGRAGRLVDALARPDWSAVAAARTGGALLAGVEVARGLARHRLVAEGGWAAPHAAGGVAMTPPPAAVPAGRRTRLALAYELVY